MDLEHVRPLVEQRLFFRVALGLLGWKPQVGECEGPLWLAEGALGRLAAPSLASGSNVMVRIEILSGEIVTVSVFETKPSARMETSYEPDCSDRLKLPLESV